jgi:hypothetical protein
MREQTPVIYFLGTSPGRYQPIIATFIVGSHPERLRVQLALGAIVGRRFKLACQGLQSVAMRFARSRRGCTKHPSEMPS